MAVAMAEEKGGGMGGEEGGFGTEARRVWETEGVRGCFFPEIISVYVCGGGGGGGSLPCWLVMVGNGFYWTPSCGRLHFLYLFWSRILPRGVGQGALPRAAGRLFFPLLRIPQGCVGPGAVASWRRCVV
jgi:hypothetical protein